jgi:transcriptional regulator with XRE-family HTH domain
MRKIRLKRIVDKSFGSILKELRINKNMTQGELSKKMSMQYTYISKLERNLVEPRLSTLIKLKKALGVSSEELITGNDDGLDSHLRIAFEKVKRFTWDDMEYVLRSIELVSDQVSKHELIDEKIRNDKGKEKYKKYIQKLETKEFFARKQELQKTLEGMEKVEKYYKTTKNA